MNPHLKSILQIAFVFFAVCLIIACGKDVIDSEITASEQLSLDFGQGKLIGEGDVKIFFAQLLEDSRCPEWNDCAYEGQFRAKLTIQQDGVRTQSEDLVFVPGQRPSILEYGNHQILIKQVFPETALDRSTELEDYRLDLEVTTIYQ